MYSVIGADGQVYGPVDLDTIRRWCQEGRVLPTTNLIDPIDGRVFPASYAPELAASFAQQPPVAPQFQAPSATMGTGYPIQGTPYPRQYGQPYGGSPRSKVVGIVLAFFLGSLGIHRFYLGHTGSGIAMLLITVLTCGYGGIITGIWALVDLIRIATGSLRDVNEHPLV